MKRSTINPAHATRSRRGFSLIELLFVIGIIVVLMALIFPVFRSLRESNQLVSCTARLQRIHQALRLYYLDETGVPPWYLDPGDPAATPARQAADPTAAATTPIGTGLMGLMQAGYVTDPETFHCPRAVYIKAGDPAYFHSYDERDVLAETNTTDPYNLFNQYKYLSTRGIVDGGPDFTRQIMPCSVPSGGSLPAPKSHPINWQPDDSTVVTWCDYHADSYTKGGDGVYNILYWDGSVLLKPEAAMRDPTHSMSPDAAWRMDPKQ